MTGGFQDNEEETAAIGANNLVHREEMEKMKKEMEKNISSNYTRVGTSKLRCLTSCVPTGVGW